VLSAALPSPPSNASAFDILTHRVSMRVAGAGDEAIDAAAHLVRTGSRSVLFGTLAVVALVGVLLGRRR
jgi:ABC-type microcin C transport system permease subunit YejE